MLPLITQVSRVLRIYFYIKRVWARLPIIIGVDNCLPANGNELKSNLFSAEAQVGKNAYFLLLCSFNGPIVNPKRGDTISFSSRKCQAAFKNFYDQTIVW